jgi:hypothetical protein
MKKYIYLFVLIIVSNLIINCSNNDGFLNADRTIQFYPKKIEIRKENDVYKIMLEDETQTINLLTNQTIEGNYNVVSQNNLEDLSKTVTCDYISSIEDIFYNGKKGTITLVPNTERIFFGIFTIVVEALNGKSIKIKIDTSEATYSNNNHITSEEFFKDETSINVALNVTYSSFIDLIKDASIFDAYYTNQIENPSSKWKIIDTHTQTSENEIVNQLWSKHYRTILRVNQTIEGALKVFDNNPSKLQPILAQLNLIRAYSYFQLINWFGDVPIYQKFYKTNEEYQIARSSQEETLKFILENIEYANENLPSNWQEGNHLKVNKNFAKALLARVYYYMKKHQQAIDILLQIDESYTLSKNIDNIEEGNTEIIFGFARADENGLKNLNFEYFYKNSYVPIIRYTEVVLLLAECYNKTGKTSKSLEYINLLKERKNISSLNSSTSEELVEITFQQWLSELNIDGNRFATLKSFNKAKKFLHIQDYQLLLPIPQQEIDTNPKATQNFGY